MVWSKIKEGNIELKHHSTASVVELIITDIEPTEDGGTEVRVTSINMDYKSFDNIKEAILHIHRDGFIP